MMVCAKRVVSLPFFYMNHSALLAKHFREVYSGGNWTEVNLMDTVSGVTLQQAMQKTGSLNTIAQLVYHIHYYVRVQLRVLQGQSLDGRDADSFHLPPMVSESDWQAFLQTIRDEANLYAGLIEKLPEEKLDETFIDPKYGNYRRNILGLIEHAHYHLGQIVLLKKLTEAAQ
jgi:uncharacterized damage-inducible protein DinB